MLKQGLSIDTTFYPSQFSLDSTFNPKYVPECSHFPDVWSKQFSVLFVLELNVHMYLSCQVQHSLCFSRPLLYSTVLHPSSMVVGQFSQLASISWTSDFYTFPYSHLYIFFNVVMNSSEKILLDYLRLSFCSEGDPASVVKYNHLLWINKDGKISFFTTVPLNVGLNQQYRG